MTLHMHTYIAEKDTHIHAQTHRVGKDIEKKLLLVKILSQKTSFEGRERKAVMESRRKRIPKLCTRQALTEST